ncbi:hypothetical protein CASFOL_039664 [Castilleja foliolosa]|uniref:Peptidase A1 domain-containing protein n=1 Tax=Castilleja foliolosa TaxID=1961234 RepID=A0ABD3BG62_9LAMI
MLIHVAFQALLFLLFVSFTTTSATRFALVHRDYYEPSSSPHQNNHFEARMKRDAMRVASLTRLVAAKEAGGSKTDLQHLGEYLAKVGVGTPPQTQTLVIDTGSSMLWVQCKPCDPPCYPQLDPVFDPKKSTSFVDVGCDDLNCYKVEEDSRGCDNTQSTCTYEYTYGDGTDISGTMAIENITIGDITVPNIIIGCTHKAQGLITENLEDGVLGLGGGSVSVMSQSGGLIGGMFSYCLGDSTKGGWLEFGRSNHIPKDNNITWATLIHNPKQPSFYYIDLVGLSVGGEVLGISGDTFQINQETGEGGVILDTGTVVTRLPQVAYEALRDKFKEKMGNIATVDGAISIFDTCYNQDEVDLNNVPTVSFNFSSQGFQPVSITLEATNVLYDLAVYVCLAFAPSPTNFGIIGNMQQQGIQITIDATGGYVGFGSGPC